MSLNVTRGRTKRPRRLLVYGTPGVGKTTFAANAPGALFIPVEEGTDDLDVARLEQPSSLDEFKERLREVAKEEHDFKTLVIDSTSALEPIIWAAVCRDNGEVDSIEKVAGGFGKGYQISLEYWIQLLDALEHIRTRRNMTIVLLAHENVETENNPAGDSYIKYYPRLHKKARQKVVEWVDECLFAHFEQFIKTEDLGFNKKQGKTKGGRRVLSCDGSKTWACAKNRLNMPETIELEWNQYQQFIDGE